MGAGVLSWQDRRVSMVCIDSQTQGPLFLFVSDDPALRKAAGEREFAPVSDLMTVSWTEDGMTYVLAGHGIIASSSLASPRELALAAMLLRTVTESWCQRR